MEKYLPTLKPEEIIARSLDNLLWKTSTLEPGAK